MRRFVCALLLTLGPLLGGVALVAAVPAPAAAAPAAPAAQEDPIQECLDRVGPQDTMERGVPSCRRDENGRWVPYWDSPARGVGAGAGLVAVFLVLALVWSGIPVLLCYTTAKNNGQSTGVAMLLGLFLGWLGLLIVYLMGRSDTRAGVHTAVDALGPRGPYGAPPGPPGWAPPAPPATGAAATEERLRSLDRLRDSGAITTEEYAAKRKAILDEL